MRGQYFRAMAAGLALHLSAAAGLAQDTGIVLLDGDLELPAGTVLAEGSIVTIEAYDARGLPLGEATFRPRSATGPLPFSFGVPEGETVTLRAAVVRAGRAEYRSADTSFDPEALAGIALLPYRPVGPAGAFRCGAERLSLQGSAGAAMLADGPSRRMLVPAPSASGARYEDPADPGAWVWMRGNSALVSVDGVALPECAAVPPPHADAYSAGGNEPGWRLSTGEGRFDLTWDYGAETARGALPPSEIGPEGIAFVTDGDIAIRVAPDLCRDDATGMPHPDRVTVEVGDRRLHGCGGDPLDLLTGRTWAVETLLGSEVPASTGPTLIFGEDGSLGGSTGCNRYQADFAIGGEGMTVGPLAATRRACLDAAARTEADLFAALRAADRFDFDDEGRLVLMDDETAMPVLTARRSED